MLAGSLLGCPTGAEFASDSRLQYAGSAAYSSASVDTCGVCGGDGSTCADCGGTPLGSRRVDACGLCADPTGPLFNASCRGCDGSPNSGRVLDACGRCLHPVTNASAFNASCSGCDGVPNSGAVTDACGVCRPPGDAAANSTCAGCDGRANSGLVFDACCACGGNATRFSACYRLLNAAESFLAFDPHSNVFENFYTPAGQLAYDRCGECTGWGLNASECTGCDGVPMSGLVTDSCGSCGGNCSTCAAPSAPQPRSAGPGVNGEPVYPSSPQNRPGMQPWAVVNVRRCVAVEREQGLVFVYGSAVGPFTVEQLLTGAVSLVDPLTQTLVDVALLPSTLVGRLVRSVRVTNFTYGETSALPARAAAWAAAARARTGVLSATDGTALPNIISMAQPSSSLDTSLSASGRVAISNVSSLRGVAYPPCTGVSYRAGAQRTHGKRTEFNSLGLIVSNNVSDETYSGLPDQVWNPSDQFIYDVADSWQDQTCVCSQDWTYQPQATAPTCARGWLSAPRVVAASRSAAAGSRHPWGLSGGGGWTMADAGGSRVGDRTTRGPWRTTAMGTLTLSSSAARPGDAPLGSPAARLVAARGNVSGAVWYAAAQLPRSALLDVNLTFRFSQPAQRCADVRQLQRSYSEEVRTRLHAGCTLQRGEGLALLLLDAAAAPTAATLGLGASGLGYARLPFSLAVEFDSHGDGSAGEPATPHVAALSRGAQPNSAQHPAARLGATDRAPAFADGQPHTARVTFAAAPTDQQLAAALAGDSFRGAGGGTLSAVAGYGAVGLLSVFLDGQLTLSLPLAPRFFLRPTGAGGAWLGLAASNGVGWQAVDVLAWSARAGP